MKRLIASDFDGTLTTEDTFLRFIRYAKGDVSFALGFLLNIHFIIMMFMRLLPNGAAKQRVFSYFFKGMSIEMFNQKCHDFAKANMHLLRKGGIDMINKALAEGDDIVIVTASIENWVQPFFPRIRVIGTKAEVKDGRLTGKFLSPNCFGGEKVNRLMTAYQYIGDYYIVAYGDSRGDKELLEFADESHFKPFRN